MKQSDLSESRSQEYIQESDGLITVLNFHLLLSNFHPLLSNFLPELWLLVVRHDENQGWRVVKCDKMLGGKSEEWSKGCTCIYTSNTASTALYSIYSIHSNYSNTAIQQFTAFLQHFYSNLQQIQQPQQLQQIQQLQHWQDCTAFTAKHSNIQPVNGQYKAQTAKKSGQ